jgi:hypothetical protein
MAQVHKSTTVAPSSPLRWQPYLGPEIHVPGTQVDSGRTFKLTLTTTVPWVRNPWLKYSSPLRWHKSTLTVAPKPTPVAQADFGRNLKPAPATKLLIFSDFHSLWLSGKCFSFLHLKPAPCGTKLSSVFMSHVKVRSARHKLDLGIQVTF